MVKIHQYIQKFTLNSNPAFVLSISALPGRFLNDFWKSVCFDPLGDPRAPRAPPGTPGTPGTPWGPPDPRENLPPHRGGGGRGGLLGRPRGAWDPLGAPGGPGDHKKSISGDP